MHIMSQQCYSNVVSYTKKPSWHRTYKDWHDRTDLKYCVACGQYKTPKRFGCGLAGHDMCLGCFNKHYSLMRRCAEFCQNNGGVKSSSGKPFAIRRLLGVLGSIDGVSWLISTGIDDLVERSDSHISLLYKQDAASVLFKYKSMPHTSSILHKKSSSDCIDIKIGFDFFVSNKYYRPLAPKYIEQYL